MQQVSLYTSTLTQLALTELAAMTHENGAPVLRLYHDLRRVGVDSQGPIIAFNVLRPDGSYVGYAEVNVYMYTCTSTYMLVHTCIMRGSLRFSKCTYTAFLVSTTMH